MRVVNAHLKFFNFHHIMRGTRVNIIQFFSRRSENTTTLIQIHYWSLLQRMKFHEQLVFSHRFFLQTNNLKY